MIGDIGGHGADDAEVIGVLGGVMEEFADFEAAFTVAGEFEGRAEGGAGGSFCFESVEGDRFAVLFREFRFWIEGVDLGGAAIHEEVDDAFCFWGEVFDASTEGLSSEHWSEGEATHAHAAATEEIASVEKQIVGGDLVWHQLMKLNSFEAQRAWMRSAQGESGEGRDGGAFLVGNCCWKLPRSRIGPSELSRPVRLKSQATLPQVAPVGARRMKSRGVTCLDFDPGGWRPWWMFPAGSRLRGVCGRRCRRGTSGGLSPPFWVRRREPSSLISPAPWAIQRRTRVWVAEA